MPTRANDYPRTRGTATVCSLSCHFYDHHSRRQQCLLCAASTWKEFDQEMIKTMRTLEAVDDVNPMESQARLIRALRMARYVDAIDGGAVPHTCLSVCPILREAMVGTQARQMPAAQADSDR
jgi:hypothetical protein